MRMTGVVDAASQDRGVEGDGDPALGNGDETETAGAGAAAVGGDAPPLSPGGEAASGVEVEAGTAPAAANRALRISSSRA